MAHRVTFRPGAEDDLGSLYAYIRDYGGGPERAIGYVRRIREACAALADFPERGTRRDDITPGLRISATCFWLLAATVTGSGIR